MNKIDNKKRNSVTRRQFIMGVGVSSVGTLAAYAGAGPVLTSAGLVSAADTTIRDDAIAGDMGTDIQLIAQTEDFVERAIKEGPGISGQTQYVADRFKEASTIFDAVQTHLRDLEYQCTQPGRPSRFLDSEVSLGTYSQFLGDEATNISLITGGNANSRKYVAKILAAIGVAEASQAIFELIGNALIKELETAGLAGNLKTFAKVAGKILKKMASKSFLKKLARKIGAKAAAKITAKIGARFVPFLGWALIIGSLIWALAEQE